MLESARLPRTRISIPWIDRSSWKIALRFSGRASVQRREARFVHAPMVKGYEKARLPS